MGSSPAVCDTVRTSSLWEKKGGGDDTVFSELTFADPKSLLKEQASLVDPVIQ